MLHISKDKIKIKEDLKSFKSYQFTDVKKRFFKFNHFIVALLIIILVMMFLPWTQFVRGNGTITTLRPDQRPQTIQSPIAGRVEQWFIQEGDFVNKGDTIVYISEIRDAFFDPLLLERTDIQVQAHEMSFQSFQEKVTALEFQIEALNEERDLKLEQASNKLLQAYLAVESDSIDLEVARTDVRIAERQLRRFESLESEGLKALSDLETKQVQYQRNLANLISQENRLLASRNEVLNARIELSRLKAEYQDKISKAESDRFSTLSSQFSAESQLANLENRRSNIQVRRNLNWITAPQSGFINRAIQRGVGETFSEGAQIVSIMPSNVDLAVEMFVNPIDLPLVHVGESVRIIFDGWPFIFFSGWPNLSYGTFGGEIVAVEQFISENGKYRVLIAPETGEVWPEPLRAGTGARTFALLNNVPVWYELWRQINGFPQDYYGPEQRDQERPRDMNPDLQ